MYPKAAYEGTFFLSQDGTLQPHKGSNCSVRFGLETLNPQPAIPKALSLNPEHETLKPQPLNPKPSHPAPETRRLGLNRELSPEFR